MEYHIRLAVVGPRCELKEAPWDFCSMLASALAYCFSRKIYVFAFLDH